MLNNYDAKETGESSVSQEQIEWVASKVTDKFNMLTVATDIPCEYKDDKPYIDGQEITVSDVKVDMCGTEYTATGDVYYKTDISTFAICLINAYGDSTIDPNALPASDGTISVTFTISGLGADPNASGDTSSASDSTSSTSSTSSTTSSTGSTTSKASTTSTKSSTSTATSSAASDNTSNSESGAPAGIALALAAVAGAAIVVSRKK
jgi:hypothetical protein